MFFIYISAIVIFSTVRGSLLNIRIVPLDEQAEQVPTIIDANPVDHNLAISIDSVETWISDDFHDDSIVWENFLNESDAFLVASEVGQLTEAEIHELDQDEIRNCERKFVSIGGFLILLLVLVIALICKFALQL